MVLKNNFFLIETLLYFTILSMISSYTIRVGSYLLFFLAFFYGIYLIFVKKQINKYLFFITITLFLMDYYSMNNGMLLYDFPFNFKWFIQVILYGFIINLFYYIFKNYYNKFEKFIMKLIVFLIFFTLVQIFYALYATSINIFDSKFLFSPLVYVFLSSSFEMFGIFKMTIGFLLPFFIMLLPNQNGIKKLLLFYSVAYNIFIGNKSVLLSLFVIYILYLITKIKYKLLKYILFATILILSLYILFEYRDEINTILIFEGRYFGPIFTSFNFWSNPFGIGAGNYTIAAKENIYNIYSYYSAVTFDKSTDIHGWYPVAESDVILWAVRYGWFFYIIFLILIGYINLNLLKTKDSCKIKSILLIDYIIFSGITQDFSNILIYWGLIGFALALFHKNTKRITNYK